MGNARNIAFWVVLFLLILLLFNLFSNGTSSINTTTIPYSEFVRAVDDGNVSNVNDRPKKLSRSTRKAPTR